MDTQNAPRDFVESLQQKKWWLSAEGPVRRKKMTLSHQLSCLSMLERRAADYAGTWATRLMISSMQMELSNSRGGQFELSDGIAAASGQMEGEASAASADPQTWIRSTPMYQALARDVVKALGYLPVGVASADSCICDPGSYYAPGFGLMRGCPVHDS